MSRKSLTLLRRTWVVPMRGSCHGDGADWGIIPPVHVEIEARATGGPTDFVVEFNGKRVLMLEPKHPHFREWMSDLISALTEAMNDPCDVLSLTQEHFAEEEEKLTGLAERFWGELIELPRLDDFDDDGWLPGGAPRV